MLGSLILLLAKDHFLESYLSKDLEAIDKNETLGSVHKNGPKPPTPLWQITQYLLKEVLQSLDTIREA